tara:strand:+ start:43 stop:576 length:534 start_codon:yes stop_codon:yes gene_type:complete
MEQTWNKEAIEEQFSSNNIADAIIGLGSEGKNLINILNQQKLATLLGGYFVGDIVDDHDFVANKIKFELKCNVNQAGDLGKTIGFASFLQKKDYDYIIHYTPKAFNNYLNEDKFVVFHKSDLPQLKKYCNNSGGIRWTHKIFNPQHKITNAGGHKEKLEFIKERIKNYEELYKQIWE